MKQAIVAGSFIVVAGVAAVGATIGPDLLAATRFEEAMVRHAMDYEANGGPWPQLQDACALCHGPNGRSGNAQYPSLAGQTAPYIEAQLHAFAEGRRRNPQMGPLAASLSADEIGQLAAYYARQAPVAIEAVAADMAVRQLGVATVEAGSCAACHGEQLEGGPAAPRLAGQGEAYLAEQLAAYKQGSRQDPTQAMNGVAASLADEEIRAVAGYIAGLATESK